MAPDVLLPSLLTAAWLCPLVSFVALTLGSLRGLLDPGSGRMAAWLATGSILLSLILSLTALGSWLANHPPLAQSAFEADSSPPSYSGVWYTLISLGSWQAHLGYHIDALTVLLFALITLVAFCIHLYSFSYLAGEGNPQGVIDPNLTDSQGKPLNRPGRFGQFFQYLSFFCFGMLGLVLADNLLQLFAFWELVGAASYFLIGYYRERPAAAAAAKQAFLVNRIGDFGFLIALMALWSAVGTLTFADLPEQRGLLRQGSMMLARLAETPQATLGPAAVGYGTLLLAGFGILAGCAGKSAQFPLHLWLPNAMQGPSPVSALVHSATMVAAGVYLFARMLPLMPAEVLLVTAYLGAFTMLLGGVLALAATDIKRVLAFSTISQLGLMMMGLGVGAWQAALLHLVTHACFKALLFLGAGAVIHSCGTNDLLRMGGLGRVMPWTAAGVLIGGLALIGLGIPGIAFGTSGFYSKEALLVQISVFTAQNPGDVILSYAALAGAGLTGAYFFRLWYLAFSGEPRDGRVFSHAHPAPALMRWILGSLAVLSVGVAWSIPWAGWGVADLLAQARPAELRGETLATGVLWASFSIPGERASLGGSSHELIGWTALAITFLGVIVVSSVYLGQWPKAVSIDQHLAVATHALKHEFWWERWSERLLGGATRRVSLVIRWLDERVIDLGLQGLAWCVLAVARFDDLCDRRLIDRAVDGLSSWWYRFGLALRNLQTGQIRHYLLASAVATAALFLALSFLRSLWTNSD